MTGRSGKFPVIVPGPSFRVGTWYFGFVFGSLYLILGFFIWIWFFVFDTCFFWIWILFFVFGTWYFVFGFGSLYLVIGILDLIHGIWYFPFGTWLLVEFVRSNVL